MQIPICLMLKMQQVPNFSDFNIVKQTESVLVEAATFSLGHAESYFATYWRPKRAKKPKALIFLSHGYAEYFGSAYDEVVEKLCSQGSFLVIGHDHVGHGRSSGQRVQVKSMDDYVQPVISHVKKVKKDFNNEIPTFIIGHSDLNFIL